MLCSPPGPSSWKPWPSRGLHRTRPAEQRLNLPHPSQPTSPHPKNPKLELVTDRRAARQRSALCLASVPLRFRGRYMPGSAILILVALIGVAFGASAAHAAQDCASLANLKVENTNLLSATEVPTTGDLPAYCRVLGFVRPAINFEVRLPLQGWNSKFYMVGCGGFCGTLDTDRPGFMNAASFGLRRHYAVVAMDSGHWGTGAVDGRWAMSNPVAQMDWGQRAVTETARVAKTILRTYYGTEQKKP